MKVHTANLLGCCAVIVTAAWRSLTVAHKMLLACGQLY